MTSKEKQQLKSQIDQNIVALRKDVSTLEKEIDPIAPDVAIGRLSRMDAIGEKSVKEALLRSTIEHIDKLEKTLVKIDDPDFDKCKKCDTTIPLVRIQAVPESGKCVNCA